MTNDYSFGTFFMEVVGCYLIDEALGLEKVDWNGRFKAPFSETPTPLPTRPENATLPPVDFASLAGTYHNPVYGSVELCLITPSNTTTASDNCNALSSSAPVRFPGAFDPAVPTFSSDWDTIWVSHIQMAHFNGNVSDVGGMRSIISISPSCSGDGGAAPKQRATLGNAMVLRSPLSMNMRRAYAGVVPEATTPIVT